MTPQKEIHFFRLALCALWMPVLLSSCSWMQMHSNELPIIHDAKGMKNVHVVQSVLVKNDREGYQFVALIEITDGNFQLVGLTSLGQRIFAIRSKEGNLEIEKSEWLPGYVSIEKLLLLFQFVYWPEDRLSQVYQGRLSIEEDDTSKRLFSGRTLLAEALFFNGSFSEGLAPISTPPWEAAVKLRHLSSGTQIFIKPVEITYL